MGNFDQPAAVDAAVAPMRTGMGSGDVDQQFSTHAAPVARRDRSGDRRRAQRLHRRLRRHLHASVTITPAEARDRLATHA